MKAAFNIPPEQGWSLSADATGFAGPPDACSGKLTANNQASRKLKIKHLTFRSHCGTLDNVPVLCQARIGAASQKIFHARAMLPLQTPPGDYKGNLLVGDEALPLTLAVLPNDHLIFQPRRVSLTGATGEKVTGQISITNAGNLEQTLETRAQVWLEAKNWAGYTLVQSIRQTQEDADYEQYLNALLHQFRKSMLPAVTLNFSGNSQHRTLQGGHSKLFNFSLILPAGMEKGKTYHGFVKIKRFRFWLAIFCNGSVQSSKRRD